MKIPKETIAEIKERTDILEVVESRLVIKRKGKDHFGLCPFHSEKSGSFSVNQDKGIYYCFGCGAKGDAIAFLQNFDKRSFTEVVLELANRYNVTIPVDPQEKAEYERKLTQKQKWLEVMAVATAFYQFQLQKSPQAIAYLRKRKTPEDLIKSFQIGFAPAGWNHLVNHMGDRHYPMPLLVEMGLAKKRDDGSHFDFFRDRLIIPICDEQGRVIAFNGRTMGDDNPKYLHSPETPLFDKGKTLYGLDKAKSAIKSQDSAIVVEGPFDVISLHANGIQNAIAALGTAFTQDHLRSIARHTESKTIIFNFDSDNAGINATHRAIAEIKDLISCGQVNAKILQLPEGDADSFIWQHQGDYQKFITSAPTWLDWNLQETVKGKNLKEAGQFSSVAKSFLKLLGEISDRSLQTFYLQRCAEILAQGDRSLLTLHTQNLARQLQSAIPKNRAIAAPSKPESKLYVAEALLIAVYFHCPEYQELIEDLLEDKGILFHDSQHRDLWRSQLSGQNPIPPSISPVIALDLLKPDLAIQSAIAAIEEIQNEFDRKTQIKKALFSCQV